MQALGKLIRVLEKQVDSVRSFQLEVTLGKDEYKIKYDYGSIMFMKVYYEVPLMREKLTSVVGEHVIFVDGTGSRRCIIVIPFKSERDRIINELKASGTIGVVTKLQGDYKLEHLNSRSEIPIAEMMPKESFLFRGKLEDLGWDKCDCHECS